MIEPKLPFQLLWMHNNLVLINLTARFKLSTESSADRAPNTEGEMTFIMEVLKKYFCNSCYKNYISIVDVAKRNNSSLDIDFFCIKPNQSQHEDLKMQYYELQEKHQNQGQDHERVLDEHRLEIDNLQREKEVEISRLKGKPVCYSYSCVCIQSHRI